MPQRQLDDLNEMIGRMLEERDADHAAYEDAQRAMAHLVVGIERHSLAIDHLIEQAKTYIVGITPSGRPA